MKRRIIFLDRDGTINEEVNYLHREEDLKIIPGVPEALRRLRELGFLLVLITNQAGIARGYYGEEDCERLNRFLNEELKKQGAWLDAVYYCPHHPEHGVGAYKKSCHCRKPEIGMFLQAESDLCAGRFGNEASKEAELWQNQCCLDEKEYQAEILNGSSEIIDLEHSYMMGDKRIDTISGHRFGLCGILLGSGYGKEEHLQGSNGDFDAYFDTMEEAVRWIEEREQKNI